MALTELINASTDKIGFSSILTAVGISAAQAADIIDRAGAWDKADTALVISMVGGLYFIYRVYLEAKVKKIELKIKEIELKRLNKDE